MANRIFLWLPGSCWLPAGELPARRRCSPATPSTRHRILPDTTERRGSGGDARRQAQKAAADSAKRTEHMFRAFGYKGIRLTRPAKAALLAAVLPGAGQVYNRRWWKLPLVYGALGGVVSGEIFYQKRYKAIRRCLTTRQRRSTPKRRSYKIGDQWRDRAKWCAASRPNSGIVFYRGYRDIFYLYIGMAYSLQIVDALVDAHLQDFDVSDDLSLHWEPALLAVPGQAWRCPRPRASCLRCG